MKCLKSLTSFIKAQFTRTVIINRLALLYKIIISRMRYAIRLRLTFTRHHILIKPVANWTGTDRPIFCLTAIMAARQATAVGRNPSCACMWQAMQRERKVNFLDQQYKLNTTTTRNTTVAVFLQPFLKQIPVSPLPLPLPVVLLDPLPAVLLDPLWAWTTRAHKLRVATMTINTDTLLSIL